MELNKRAITIHGGRVIFVLTPLLTNSNITAGHDHKGYVLIWGNGSGYQFLAECFSIAAELKKDEILYIPTQFRPGEEFKELFNNCDYDLNIVCTNYCGMQISPKDIDKVIHIKVCSEQVITRSPVISTDFVERWKTDRRLTIKINKQNMCISTNRDGFYSLACGANNMAEYGDIYYDSFLPHVHYDWNENTSISVGVTLYHWHNK